MPKISKCYHDRNSWLICGGYIEWCYVCGAFRNMRKIEGNSVTPNGKWQKPSGDKKINPYKSKITINT